MFGKISSMNARTRNFSIVCLCLLYALFRGRAVNVKGTPTRIILFPSGKLGDVVCTTPVIKALAENKKDVFVAASSRVVTELLSGLGSVNGFIDTRSFWSGIRNVRKGAFDACIVTGPTFRSVATAFLAGIPFIVAPRIEGGSSIQHDSRPYQTIKKFITTVPYTVGMYMPRERLRTLEPLGIVTEDTSKHLFFSASAEKKVSELLKENGIDPHVDFVIGITPSAGNKIKEWPVERFAKVADYLVEKYAMKIILIGGPNDCRLVQGVVSHLEHAESIFNAQGKCTIDELKALISKLHVFISVDTGPIYIAEAFNIPTIDITGPIDEREQPPIGERHIVITPPHRKAPELFVMNARDYNYREARRQAESITVDMVISGFDALYSRITSNHE